MLFRSACPPARRPTPPENRPRRFDSRRFRPQGGMWTWSRAERRLGEFLAQTERAKGTAGAGRPKLGGPVVVPPKSEPTLADLGISKNESSKAQKLAARPARYSLPRPPAA